MSELLVHNKHPPNSVSCNNHHLLPIVQLAHLGWGAGQLCSTWLLTELPALVCSTCVRSRAQAERVAAALGRSSHGDKRKARARAQLNKCVLLVTSGLSHVTCFGQRDVSRVKGWRSTYCVQWEGTEKQCGVQWQITSWGANEDNSVCDPHQGYQDENIIYWCLMLSWNHSCPSLKGHTSNDLLKQNWGMYVYLYSFSFQS